jgi:CheY-like chemotaxis protein
VTLLLGVDDSKTMRKVLEITFAGENYRTVFAASANDALDKLGAEPPSVVLVDAALEGLNGYELCERIKSASPGVPVILLSSKQQPYDRNRGGQVGADDHIDKPFDTQQLIDKVSAAIRKSTGVAAPAAPPLAAVPTPTEAARSRTQTLAYGAPLSPVAPISTPPAYSAPAAYAAPQAYGAPTNVFTPSAPDFGAPAAAPVAPPPLSAPPAALSSNGPLAGKLSDLGLTPEQIAGVLALSREVVEKVVWEVVPVLAETMIREEIKRLTSE